MAKPLRLGIAGLGTVGVGVVRILRKHAALLEARTGRPLVISAVSARSHNKDRGVSLSDYAWETDPTILATRDDVDVFVELMGGEDGPAKNATEAALAAGKHVVTANKAMLACRQSGFSGVFRRASIAAHKFDKYINIIALRQCDWVIFPGVVGQRHTTVFVFASGRHCGDRNFTTCARSK